MSIGLEGHFAVGSGPVLSLGPILGAANPLCTFSIYLSCTTMCTFYYVSGRSVRACLFFMPVTKGLRQDDMPALGCRDLATKLCISTMIAKRQPCVHIIVPQLCLSTTTIHIFELSSDNVCLNRILELRLYRYRNCVKILTRQMCWVEALCPDGVGRCSCSSGADGRSKPAWPSNDPPPPSCNQGNLRKWNHETKKLFFQTQQSRI